MNTLFKNIFYLRKAFMLSVIFFTAFYSCKKDGELYPAFNDEGLTVSFTDTFSIETSVLADTIRTDIASLNLLGIYHDSITGLHSSSVYTQLTLSGADVNFGSNAVIDSVILSLKYNAATSFYGNLLTQQSIEVYRLNEAMSNEEYYSNDSLGLNGILGSLNFYPYLNDSVQVINNGDTSFYDPHIRIALSNTFGQELINAGTGGNTIADNTELLSIINGLYITPSTNVNNSTLAKGDGAIIYYDVNSSLSTLTLYYHNDTDTTSYSFLINSESKKFNRFEHNYANTDVENQLAGSNYDSTITYIQSMGGLKTKIEIPHIKRLASLGTIIINKAELVFPLNSEASANYPAVVNTSLTGINEEGTAVFLVDNFEGSDYFGGSLTTENTYKFNIARHIQQLINNPDQEDYGLYLMATGTAVSANRSIINSAQHPSSKIKLNITYTKP